MFSLFSSARRKKRFVFVVGCGHSGTSLMIAMLGAHPDCYAIPYETGAFLKDDKQDPAEIIWRIANSKNEPVICEKTPSHIHHVERIAATFPDCSFIKMVRDPRDVACSIKRRVKRLDAGIDRWLTDNSAPIDERGDCLVIRYEDLISAPSETLDRSCRHLRLSFEPVMLSYWQDRRDWFGVSERRDTDGAAGPNHTIRRNWQLHQPMMKDRVGVFRHELAVSEIIHIEQRTAPLASRYGYDFART